MYIYVCEYIYCTCVCTQPTEKLKPRPVFCPVVFFFFLLSDKLNKYRLLTDLHLSHHGELYLSCNRAQSP